MPELTAAAWPHESTWTLPDAELTVGAAPHPLDDGVAILTYAADHPGGVLDLVDAVPTGLANPGVAILARGVDDIAVVVEHEMGPSK